jgi:hypothetical protein
MNESVPSASLLNLVLAVDEGLRQPEVSQERESSEDDEKTDDYWVEVVASFRL